MSFPIFSSSYEKVHKQLETCALVTKNTSTCIQILENDMKTGNDEARTRSVYKSLVEIYMTCINIDKEWMILFRKAFESVVNDHNIRDHVKVYIKYLKILRNLKEYDALLKSAIQMLEMYPAEYIPLEMVCLVYVNKYGQKDICFDVSLNSEIMKFKHQTV